jgi:hypothetical protein
MNAVANYGVKGRRFRMTVVLSTVRVERTRQHPQRRYKSSTAAVDTFVDNWSSTDPDPRSLRPSGGMLKV